MDTERHKRFWTPVLIALALFAVVCSSLMSPTWAAIWLYVLGLIISCAFWGYIVSLYEPDDADDNDTFFSAILVFFLGFHPYTIAVIMNDTFLWECILKFYQ